MKKNKLVIATLLATSVCGAASSAFASANEVYATLGSTGLGLGYAYGLNDRFSVRGEYAGFVNYDGTYTTGGTDYHGTLKLNQYGVFGDYFPFAGTFRISAGYVSTDSKFIGRADGGSGTVTINHVKYPLAGESASATVKLPTSMPYLGVGWGHNATKPGWGVVADIGIEFGNPKTTIALSPNLAAQVPPSDVRAEERSISDDLKVLGGFPVLSIGVGYRF